LPIHQSRLSKYGAHDPTIGKQWEKLFRPANPQSREETIENYGLKSEVLHVFKLGCTQIILTAEEKSSGRDEIERSLAKEPAVTRVLPVAFAMFLSVSLPSSAQATMLPPQDNFQVAGDPPEDK
jgi:hypothetical protein